MDEIQFANITRDILGCKSKPCDIYWINDTVGALDQPEATPDPEIERLQFNLSITRFIVQKILTPLVVCFGVVGNGMEIAVLTRRWMRSSTNMYLTALAIFDTLYLLFSLTMSFKHYDSIMDTNWFVSYYKPFGRPLIDTWSNTAVWLTLTFTVERYIGVCHPMKGKRWCTPERAQYVIIAVCVTVSIITFPEFFAYKVIKSLDKNNSTKLLAIKTNFSKHYSYNYGFVYTLQALFTFLPLLLLLVFNILLIKAVMRATKERRAMTKVTVQNSKQEKQNREQHRITIMLISVVIVFLMCQLPQAILNLYVTYLIVSKNMTNVLKYKLYLAGNVLNLFVMCNSSTNFILYSAFSTKFRRTFKTLFCKCLRPKQNKEEIISGVYPGGVYSSHSPRNGSKANIIVHTTASGTMTVAAGSNLTPQQRNKQKMSKNGYIAVEYASNEPSMDSTSVL